MSQATSSVRSHPLVLLAAVVVIIAGMKAASSILVLVLVAAFVAIITLPALTMLKRRGMPEGISILILLLVLLIAGYGLVVLLSLSLDRFAARLPYYSERLAGLMTQFEPWAMRLGLESDFFNPAQLVQIDRLTSFIGPVISAFQSTLGNALIVFLALVFMLLEINSLPSRLHAIAARPETVDANLQRFYDDINRYMGIKALISAVTGVLVGVWLWLFEVDFAFLLGMLAFLLNFIPVIGSLIAAIPGVLMALLQHGPGTMIWVLIGYLAVNQIVGSLIEPKVLGNRLGLSALVVFLSLVIWGWIFGPVGMFLAVPLTMTVKLGLASSDRTRWLALLMSASPEAVKPTVGPIGAVSGSTRTPQEPD